MSSSSHAESVLHAFAQHLAALGLLDWDGGHVAPGPDYTSSTPWPTFLGPNMPTKPSRALVLTATTATTERGNVMQGLQVRARDAADTAQWDVLGKLQQIRDHLNPGGNPRSSFIMGGMPVSKVVTIADPQPLALDAERRPGATLNFRIHSRRIAAP